MHTISSVSRISAPKGYIPCPSPPDCAAASTAPPASGPPAGPSPGTTLCISVDLDTVHRALLRPNGTVPMQITVQGDTVFRG
jgi:hypothetical protein